MLKLTVSFLLFSVLFLFSSASFSQDSEDFHVVHIQTNKMKGMLDGDTDAFNQMLKRQTDVMSSDPRVVRVYALRHFWGDDSRDLVIVTEFMNTMDLFSFYNDMDSMIEKAYSKEQRDADDAMWNKYVGQHSDEIYRVVLETTK